ncbi:MAG TPA: PDDEXK nuclease domain-containing protein [Edaphobacter sp.]|nr:PDDEXK nuclease domain-containing protein [Edaphobacter sp.]
MPILLFHTAVGYDGYGKRTVPLRSKPSNLRATKQDEATFSEVVRLIAASRERAFQAVNTELIDLYWQVGATISRKIKAAEWGDGVVERLAAYIAKTQPGLRGFTRANLFRMRQFYETYQDDEKVAPLVRQLPWSHHLIILGQSKRPEEREFYLRLAIKERWSKRELERQFQAALFERIVLSPPKVSPAVRQIHPEALSIFRDAYNVEFLGLPPTHAEADLHRGLLDKLKDFLIELGRDFCFVASEYPLQVGNRDFALDLLFFHRGLNCLVAIELKVGRFEPEYLGKLAFYLEALDRDVRKAHEQPSIGVLLCASKNDEVVEYALSRSLSPALIAEYQTQLPDKKLLQAKLHEFYLQNAHEDDLSSPERKQPARKRSRSFA